MFDDTIGSKKDFVFSELDVTLEVVGGRHVGFTKEEKEVPKSTEAKMMV